MLKELEEKRAELQAEMEQLLNGAKEEKRAMSEEESAKFDGLEREIKNIDATMAAEKRAAKKAENAPLVEALQAILTDEPMTASQIAERVEGINNSSKATVIAKILVESGVASVTEVKVKGRAVKGYFKA